MNTVRKYQKEIRKMFFVSVDKDLDKWTHSGRYYSPQYANSKLSIDDDTGDRNLWCEVDHNGSILIKKYKFIFIPTDFKMCRYVKKVKNHFRRIDIDAENEVLIKKLKRGLNDIQENYIKEVRKEKIDQINQS